MFWQWFFFFILFDNTKYLYMYVNTLKSSSQVCFGHCVFIVILLLRKFYIWDIILCSAIFTFIIIYICMCPFDDSSPLFFTVHKRLPYEIKTTCAVEKQLLKRKQNTYIMTTGSWWLETYRFILRFKAYFPWQHAGILLWLSQ